MPARETVESLTGEGTTLARQILSAVDEMTPPQRLAAGEVTGQTLIESDHLPDLKTQVIGELREALPPHACARTGEPGIEPIEWRLVRDGEPLEALGRGPVTGGQPSLSTAATPPSARPPPAAGPPAVPSTRNGRTCLPAIVAAAVDSVESAVRPLLQRMADTSRSGREWGSGFHSHG